MLRFVTCGSNRGREPPGSGAALWDRPADGGSKMLAFSVPPGYRRSRRPARPKLDPFTGIIDSILVEDEVIAEAAGRTSKRVFERLRDEHGYSGGITWARCRLGGCVVARYLCRCGTILAMRRLILVRHRRDRRERIPRRSTFLRWICRTATRALCVPIWRRPPKRSVTVTTPRPSSARYTVRSFTTTRRWRWRVMGDGVRQRTHMFSELQSHYVLPTGSAAGKGHCSFSHLKTRAEKYALPVSIDHDLSAHQEDRRLRPTRKAAVSSPSIMPPIPAALPALRICLPMLGYSPSVGGIDHRAFDRGGDFAGRTSAS